VSTIPRKPIPKSVRDRVKSKFKGRCGYCGEESERLQVDHINPLASMRGTNEESNLMPSCFQCNNFKGDMTLEEFRNSLEENPRKAMAYSVNHRMALKYHQIEVIENQIVFYFKRNL